MACKNCDKLERQLDGAHRQLDNIVERLHEAEKQKTGSFEPLWTGHLERQVFDILNERNAASVQAMRVMRALMELAYTQGHLCATQDVQRHYIETIAKAMAKFKGGL